ncbi:hypothetical protein H5410_030357 [Solanum commersonii]|uniref:Uncharacterized protein n=1 Tax=Solanum commersonii TaxID=4109 RepID=A0A9J5YE34_SOLCO|nr:hypothetical protein H5410_030357 [Solanum commersonii]
MKWGLGNDGLLIYETPSIVMTLIAVGPIFWANNEFQMITEYDMSKRNGIQDNLTSNLPIKSGHDLHNLVNS